MNEKTRETELETSSLCYPRTLHRQALFERTEKYPICSQYTQIVKLWVNSKLYKYSKNVFGNIVTLLSTNSLQACLVRTNGKISDMLTIYSKLRESSKLYKYSAQCWNFNTEFNAKPLILTPYDSSKCGITLIFSKYKTFFRARSVKCWSWYGYAEIYLQVQG